MQMTPEQRQTTEQFRLALNAIHRNLDTGMLPIELATIDQACEDIFSLQLTGPEGRAWNQAACATKDLLYERGEQVRTAWLVAYAELPPMEWPSQK